MIESQSSKLISLKYLRMKVLVYKRKKCHYETTSRLKDFHSLLARHTFLNLCLEIESKNEWLPNSILTCTKFLCPLQININLIPYVMPFESGTIGAELGHECTALTDSGSALI